MKDFIVTKVIWNNHPYLTAAFYEDGTLSELRAESAEEKSIVGNVYRGYTKTVSKNIHGAFVRINKKTPVYLPMGKSEEVQASQPILVQVTKDASGRKAPVVTENIHLAGIYCVLSRFPGKTSFSTKLTSAQKEMIRGWIPHGIQEKYHLLIRTNAVRGQKEDFLQELERLIGEMSRILTDYEKASTGDLLYQPEPFYLTMARDLYEKPDRVCSEIPAVSTLIGPFAKNQGDYPVQKEMSGMSLSELYNLHRDLSRLMAKTVYLKSGAFLVIEQTEAFVSIDVNTGKCRKGRKPEETYREINREAALEIARQLRLRNLSGMILIDFINMESEDHKDELIHLMQKYVKKDHIHTEVIDLTPLGIMEIVRQKVRKPLAEVLTV